MRDTNTVFASMHLRKNCESIWAGLTNAIIIVRVAGFMLELIL